MPCSLRRYKSVLVSQFAGHFVAGLLHGLLADRLYALRKNARHRHIRQAQNAQ